MSKITRTIESHDDRSFLVLSYDEDRIVIPLPARVHIGVREAEAINDALRTMDRVVQQRLQDAGARLDYEGHVQVEEQEGGSAYDGITLHDSPFQDIDRVPHWSRHGSVVDNGTDLGKILREMLGANQFETVAFRGRVIVEVLEARAEAR